MKAQFSQGTLKRLSMMRESESSQSRSKRPFIVLGTLVGIFVASTAVLAVILGLKSKAAQKNADNELCVTPYCVKAANYLIESLDETVEPCEDFYHFVCGTWIKNSRIPDDAYAWGGVILDDSDVVTVHELEYLNNVSSIIDQTSARLLQNYVVWRFMMHRVDNMPKRFRSIKENFQHIFRGTTADVSRKIICGNFVNGNMGFAVSALYIKKYFDDNARIQSSEMIGNIRKSFIDMVEKSSWMDETSRKKAIEKAEAIDEKIGYPDYLASDNMTQLETQYADYKFTSSYINNVLKLIQIKAKEEFQILRKTVDRKAWGFTAPTVVNAFYAPSKNQITFPAGILQMPFFDKDAPKYLNYGGEYLLE
ncbi:unnamed protein product [Rotaria magnacalcarata]|uniref:Uncharacterized protein n=1 Tax=Rotaria magnacalcarata TaxID=392030 RepID=A0A8S2SKC3_9BILA|nr:unnamed protein product [Rotaria magnacalcarata]